MNTHSTEDIHSFIKKEGSGICRADVSHQDYLTHADFVSASDLKDWSAQRFIQRAKTTSMGLGTLVHSLIESRLEGTKEPDVRGPFHDDSGKVLRANSKAYKLLVETMPEGTTVLNASDWERYSSFKTCVDIGFEGGVLSELMEFAGRDILKVENSLYFTPNTKQPQSLPAKCGEQGGVWAMLDSLGKTGLRARPDAFCVDHNSKTIWVFDFKTTSKETLTDVKRESYIWDYNLSMQHYAFMTLLCAPMDKDWSELESYTVNTTLIYIHTNNFLGPLQLTKSYKNVVQFLESVILENEPSAYHDAITKISDDQSQDITQHLSLPEVTCEPDQCIPQDQVQ